MGFNRYKIILIKNTFIEISSELTEGGGGRQDMQPPPLTRVNEIINEFKPLETFSYQE